MDGVSADPDVMGAQAGPVYWSSLLAGGALTFYGLSRDSAWVGVPATVAGMALLVRGLGGAASRVGEGAAPTAIHLSKSVTVQRSPEEVYRLWRDLEDFPRFMRHIERVERRADGRYHWVAKAPFVSEPLTWDAELVEDRPGERVSWRSLGDGPVDTVGAVVFRPAAGGRGTEVHVDLDYRPRQGSTSRLAARLLSPLAEQMLKEDIRRFKQMLEAGEIATVDGQSVGPRA